MELLEAKVDQGIELPEWVPISGINLKLDTLRFLDDRKIEWLGLASSKTPLLSATGKKWNFEEIKKKTLKNNPHILEIPGWDLHCKAVHFEGYGALDFCVLLNLNGAELGCFLMKK